jgi:lipopolysaccharide transport system permease protein
MTILEKTLPKRQCVYLRDLLWELVARDIKLRYKRSVLGIAWSLLNPLLQLLVFHFVFSWLLPLNIPNYAAFLFTGILVWSWFQTSLFAASGAIVDNPDLIKRPGFPVAILPVVTVTTHLIHFLLALPILLIALAFSGIQVSGAILVLPLIIGLQFFLTLSLAYFVATIHVIFRDTQYLLGIFLLLGFYLSPVFYQTSIIPAQYQFAYHLNPMVDLIDAYRAILMQGNAPNGSQLLILGLVTAALLGLGYFVFVRTSYRFVEEL